jgi:hypothetical protein
LKIGINQPWQNYGWDFGPDVRPQNGQRISVPRWNDSVTAPNSSASTRLAQQLDEYKDYYITAVRWFILGDGWNYGVPTFQNGVWTFSPPSINNTKFATDFETLLKTFSTTSIRLVPSFVDFRFLWPGMLILNGKEVTPKKESSLATVVANHYKANRKLVPDQATTFDWNRFVKCGRYDVLSTPQKQDQFLADTLVPLLTISSRYSNQILWWEVINEPEMALRQGTVTLPMMRRFILRGCEEIAKCGFKSTVGFADCGTLETFWGPSAESNLFAQLVKQGKAIGQFHYYPEYGNGSPRLVTAKKNWVIGEFGTSPLDKTKLVPWPTWPDLDPKKSGSVKERLRLISDKGYRYAFPWAAESRDSISFWDPVTQIEIQAFVEGR